MGIEENEDPANSMEGSIKAEQEILPEQALPFNGEIPSVSDESRVVEDGILEDTAQRTVRFAPVFVEAGLSVQTNNGSISVKGENRTDCEIVAVIEGKARTNKGALERVQQVNVRVERNMNELSISTESPEKRLSDSVIVNYELRVPLQTVAQFRSNNGTIDIQSLSGKIQAQANNGKITIAGGTFDSLRASLNNGEITAKEISGNLNCSANNGKVVVAYAETADGAVNAEIRVNNGAIDFTGPKNLSASVAAETDLGNIESDWPMGSSGFLGKRLSGTIGEGKGKIYLKNNTGAIRIHKQ